MYFLERKKLSLHELRTTSYFFNVIYSYLVALLEFFYDFILFRGTLALISQSAFSPFSVCTIFQAKSK